MCCEKPPDLTIPWQVLHKLVAARIGYGDFATYRLLKHTDASLEHASGQETNLTHFIRSRSHINLIGKLQNSMTMNDFIRAIARWTLQNYRKDVTLVFFSTIRAYVIIYLFYLRS